MVQHLMMTTMPHHHAGNGPKATGSNTASGGFGDYGACQKRMLDDEMMEIILLKRSTGIGNLATSSLKQ